MRAKLDEIKTALMGDLARRLEPDGFRKVAGKVNRLRLSRKTSFGKQTFQISPITHNGVDVDFTASATIRFEALQKLEGENESELFLKHKIEGGTMGAELGNISVGRNIRWTVAESADIPLVAASIHEAYRTIAVPYFEKYSNMESALEILSRDDQEAWLHVPFDGSRARHALGLAYLLGKRDAFCILAEQKIKFLKERNDLELESVLEFKNKLEAMWRDSKVDMGWSGGR